MFKTYTLEIATAETLIHFESLLNTFGPLKMTHPYLEGNIMQQIRF